MPLQSSVLNQPEADKKYSEKTQELLNTHVQDHGNFSYISTPPTAFFDEASKEQQLTGTKSSEEPTAMGSEPETTRHVYEKLPDTKDDCCSDTITSDVHRDWNPKAKTPFGINRYILLTILFIYLVFAGTHFFNWTPWETILTTNGAYSSLCDDAASSCQSQLDGLHSLLPTATVSMLSFTFVAGFLLDLFGPRICSLIGTTFLLLAWVILACVPSHSVLYKIGFVFIGAGTDPAFFGTLSLANLFPGYESTVISILGAARSVSNFLPLVMLQLQKAYSGFTFRVMAIVFIVLYGLCLLVVILFVPRKPYKIPTHPCLTEVTQLSRPSIIDGKSLESVVRKGKLCTSTTTSTRAFSTFSFVPRYHREDLVAFKAQALGFARQCMTALYIPIIIISTANVIRCNYYLTSATTQLGSSIETFLGIINVVAFLPGPLFGLIVDKFGPLSVIAGLNTSTIITYILLLIAAQVEGSARSALQYISVILVFPELGYMLSQTYIYIAYYFPARDMGKLAGFACFAAGLLGLVVPSMTSYSAQVGSFLIMNLVNVILSIIVFVAVAFLILTGRSRKPGQQRKRVRDPHHATLDFDCVSQPV